MSQTINFNGQGVPTGSINGGSLPVATIPQWMTNIVSPSDSFESEIGAKIGSYPHYPGPIRNVGGLHLGSHCRIPGVQPFVQSILRPNTCVPHCLTQHCYEYGNTRFPPKCECDDKYDCRSYEKCYSSPKCGSVGSETYKTTGWSKSSCHGNCSSTCGTCNHNSNVIFQ